MSFTRLFALWFVAASLFWGGSALSQLSLTGAGSTAGGSVAFGCPGTPILLSSPNDVSAQPPWSSFNINGSSGAPDPFGGTTGSQIVVNASTFAGVDQSAGTLTGGTSYSFRAYLAPQAGSTWVFIELYDGVANFIDQWFDFSGSGTIGTAQLGGDGSVLCAQIRPSTNGFYEISLSASFVSTHALTLSVLMSDGDTIRTATVGQEIGFWGVGT